jgi:hypothetical protein
MTNAWVQDIAKDATINSQERYGLARFCGFLDVPPPDSGESCSAVFGHQIGMAEAIPSRGAHFVIVPLRNDVVVPQQNAIECSRSCLEIGAVLSEDNLVDHGIDRGVFDANPVR